MAVDCLHCKVHNIFLPQQTCFCFSLLMNIFCTNKCVCVYACGWTGHFLWPVWHLTHAVNILCIILSFTGNSLCLGKWKICYFVSHCSFSTPPLLFVSCAVQQKQQLEKETGLKIVEAGVSDVSHPLYRKKKDLLSVRQKNVGVM